MKTKKVISLLLVVVIMCTTCLSFPAVAANYISAEEAASFQQIISPDGDSMFFCQQTEEMIVVIHQSASGKVVVAYLYPTNPNIVYEWEAPTAVHVTNTREAAAVKHLALADELHTKTSVIPTVEKQGIIVDREAAVIAMMEQEFGDPFDWRVIASDSSTYYPYVAKVRQDRMYEVTSVGLTELPPELTIAAGIALFVAKKIPQGAAVIIMVEIFEKYGFLDAVLESLYVETYRGLKLDIRYGTITPTGGTETAVETATLNCFKYYAIVENEDEVEEMVDTGNEIEEVYIPSEYMYSEDVLMEHAYEGYVG